MTRKGKQDHEIKQKIELTGHEGQDSQDMKIRIGQPKE
jgi:hypothetical protein